MGKEIWLISSKYKIYLIRLKSTKRLNINHEKYYLIVTVPVIIQHDIWNPNVFGRHIQLFDASIFFRIPTQLIIEPTL